MLPKLTGRLLSQFSDFCFLTIGVLSRGNFDILFAWLRGLLYSQLLLGNFLSEGVIAYCVCSQREYSLVRPLPATLAQLHFLCLTQHPLLQPSSS